MKTSIVLIASLSIVSSSLCAKSIPEADLYFPTEGGTYILPISSISSGGDTYSTDLILFDPSRSAHNKPDGETPASLGCIYGLTPPVTGCNKNSATILPSGGWGAIALVDAFYNPNAESDLNTFSNYFGLPACTTSNGCFHLVYASGSRPSKNGWEDEQAIDIEMAHALAPNAKIYLVEAASNSTDDLLQAEDVAGQLVAQAGGGVVSNSWGRVEYPGESSDDVHFQVPGVVYVASSGDYSAGARYPSSSPYIVSAGGTTIVRNAQGDFTGEIGWSSLPNQPPGYKWGSSGGPSLYISRPSYQNVLQKLVGTQRGTPDIAFLADPKTGAAIYSTHRGGWFNAGGTSVAAPSLAGLINAANHRARSTLEELSYIYSHYPKRYHEFWHDILIGNTDGFRAMQGYDFVTGLGSPRGYQGK